jgi:hypothetical protein
MLLIISRRSNSIYSFDLCIGMAVSHTVFVRNGHRPRQGLEDFSSVIIEL